MTTIKSKDIRDMVTHWLQTPVNGYLGSDYGQDAKSMLQKPMADSTAADGFLAKLRNDVPAIEAMPAGTVNLYTVDTQPDQRQIVISVGNALLNVSEIKAKINAD